MHLYPQEGLNLLFLNIEYLSNIKYYVHSIIVFLDFTAISTILINEVAIIPMLAGDENFSDWKEKIELFFGCKDFDLALYMDKHILTNESTQVEKDLHA